MVVLRRFLPSIVHQIGKINPHWAAYISLKLFFAPARYPRSPEEVQFWKTGRLAKFPSGCKGRIYGDSRRTVWFVHGWEGRSSRFEVLIDAAVLAGFKAIAWDGPAHGDSPGRSTNLIEFAQALKKDVSSREDEVIHAVVGHSFGGAAAAYACKLGLPAKKLVLISSPSNVQNVLLRFWSALKLVDYVQPFFLKRLEKITNVTLMDVSTETFIGKLSQKIQVIHDKSDKEIPFAEAEVLKIKNPEISLVGTDKLGHRRILDSQIVATFFTKFLVS